MRYTRLIVALVFVAVFVAVPGDAQWISSGSDTTPNQPLYTGDRVGINFGTGVGQGATNKITEFLNVYNDAAGFNFKMFDYTYFGTIYSSWQTIIGYNVKANSGQINRAEFANTHGGIGGLAIIMNADGIELHAQAPPSTAGNAFFAPKLTVTPVGVGIGTRGPTSALHVVGNANVTGTLTGGNIAATYQDVAEWVPSTDDIEPGTVVVLNTSKNNEVMPSATAYDTKVAGVVSAQPGLLLGVKDDNMEMIATTGRVKVRVDASARPIAVGDLLVTSSKPGVAMKSVPVDLNGIAIHRPGTIIGKALEPLASGQGEILVLLSMQ